MKSTHMETALFSAGISEIPEEEQLRMNGGSLPVIAALAVVIVAQVIDDWDNFKNGLMGRPEEK